MVGADSCSRIVAWNAATAELFGREPVTVLGKPCAEVLKWRDRHGNLVCWPDRDICQRALRDWAGTTQVVLATGKSGCVVWASVSSLVLPPEHHQICRVVHLVREVTFTPLEEAAIRVARQDHWHSRPFGVLTAREHDVLDLMADGMTSADIATRLGISPITVQNHIAHILTKLKVHTRLEAVCLALRAR